MVNLRSRRSRAAGFTLIELIVVVTIIGLLAGIAMINIRNAQRRAAENVLRADLNQLRKAIDDFYADKQRYPNSLQEIVQAGYLRRIPIDPITKSATTWVEVREEVMQSEAGGADPFAPPPSFSPGPEGQMPFEPGVADVRSGAEGETLDGVKYSEL